MEVVKFDITGKFAHFRKFYSNNSALSYSLPPRTSIIGILAAIAGLDKDSFYEIFSSQNLNISVFSASPVKKTFHRINTLMIKGYQDFRGRLGHTQTPIEVISGYSINRDLVKYTIYLENLNIPSQIYERLLKNIFNKTSVYNLSLGLASFTACIENPQKIEAEKQLVQSADVELYSIANANNVNKIYFKQENPYDFIEEETMPADFDKDRKTIKLNKVIYTLGGSPLKINISGQLYILSDGRKIQMLE